MDSTEVQRIDAQIYEIRNDARLDDEERGKRLEPLYVRKAALTGLKAPSKATE
jgi:hypothetical protein